MSKVLLALEVVRIANIDLGQKRIFDYGFGAGTFFRYCPLSAQLFGVEMDAQNVRDVALMLQTKGYREVDLRQIKIENWSAHPFLRQQYDFILCSHVLEHLVDPVGFLKILRHCLAPGGHFLGLVPLNEREDNPHHVHKPDKAMIASWAENSGYHVQVYCEADEIFYPFQPLYIYDEGFMHKLAQAVSLGLGVFSTVMGPNLWWRFNRLLRHVFPIKPTQAAFLLTAE
ncbi:MAG: class I SAM-dependent methyltransferase [Phycisphaerae bacterium]